MAENWPWESLHNTQSGSSQSSQEATAVVRETERPSLVETLQTCLATTSPGRALSEPSGGVTVASTLRQSRSSGALSGSTSSKSVMKRRSRATRSVPTTVVETTSSDFKETVHRLTGIAPPTATPVRPQPKRVGPATFVRPVPQVQAVRVPGQMIATSLPSSPQVLPPASWPQFDPFIKSEPHIGVSSTAAFRSANSSTTSMQTWWDAGLQEPSQSHSMMIMSPTTTGPFDVSTSSAAQILQDDPDLSIDDSDLSWFQHGSDYMH